MHLVIVRAPPEPTRPPEPEPAPVAAPAPAPAPAPADVDIPPVYVSFSYPSDDPEDVSVTIGCDPPKPAAAEEKKKPPGFFDQLGKSTAKLFGIKSDEEKSAEKEAALQNELLASAEEARRADAAAKLQARARGLAVRTQAAEAAAAAREAEAAALKEEAALKQASLATLEAAEAAAAAAAAGRAAADADKVAYEKALEAEAAATKMQAMARGRQGRKLADEEADIAEDSEEATVAALAVASAKVAAKAAEKAKQAEAEAEAAHDAAKRLQAVARGSAARRSLGGMAKRDTAVDLMALYNGAPAADAEEAAAVADTPPAPEEETANSATVIYVHKGEPTTRLGLTLGNLDGANGLVQVQAVATDKLGAEAGLVVGDVLLAVNGEEVSTHEEAKGKIASAAGTLTLTLRLPRPDTVEHEQLQERLMRAGHNANKAGDYVTARAHFTECYELGGRMEARISAVNMALKLGLYREAAEAYAHLMRQDLPPAVMSIIERKYAEAYEKLAAAHGGGGAGGVGGVGGGVGGVGGGGQRVAVDAHPVDGDGDTAEGEENENGQLKGFWLQMFANREQPQSGNGLCCAAKRKPVNRF